MLKMHYKRGRMQEKYHDERVVVVWGREGARLQVQNRKVRVDMPKPGKTKYKTEFLSLSVCLSIPYETPWES